MSEDAKIRSIAGGLTVMPPISDDQKPLSAAATTLPPASASLSRVPTCSRRYRRISIFSIIGRSLYDFACCLVHKIFDYHLKCIVHPSIHLWFLIRHLVNPAKEASRPRVVNYSVNYGKSENSTGQSVNLP
ncbi:hypothetical protein SLA2020_377940 [Shorea laevis]